MYKRQHLGYVANLVETVGENKNLITDYAYEQNIYGDSQFMKDHLSKEPIYEQDVLMVADGAYGSELNVAEAAKHGIRLITTNFTGVKPTDIFAEFIFSKDRHELLECINHKSPYTCLLYTSSGMLPLLHCAPLWSVLRIS